MLQFTKVLRPLIWRLPSEPGATMVMRLAAMKRVGGKLERQGSQLKTLNGRRQ